MTEMSRSSTTPGATYRWMDFSQRRFTPVLVFLYLLAAALCMLLAPILFFQTVRVPFIGAFVEHTLMINASGPTQSGTWDFHKQNPVEEFGYQLVAADGSQVNTVQEYLERMRGYGFGDQIELDVRAPDGAMELYSVHLEPLPLLDQLSYFIIPYLTGLVYLFSSIYIFAVRRNDPAGRSFTVFTASCAVGLGALYDLNTTNYFTYFWTISLAMAGGSLINLALLFPENVPWIVRYPFLRWLGYIPTILLILLALPTLYNFNQPTVYVAVWRAEYIFLGLASVFFIGMVAARRFTSSSPVVREQARLIFWGALLSFGPLAIWFVLTSIWPTVRFTSLLLLPLGVFPVLTGYAIIRYRLLNTDYVLSRVVLYAALTILAVGGYAFLVTGLTQLFGGIIQPTNPVVIGVIVFILAVLFNPARVYLQGLIDSAFFRGRSVYRERQQAFGRELTQAIGLHEIVSLLRRYINESLLPDQMHIFVFDSLVGYYAGSPDEINRRTTDIRFNANSALVQVLSSRGEALFLTDIADLPDALQSDQSRIALLGAELFVPLLGRQQLIGWMALGSRRSGEPYTSQDLEFLVALSDQAALAVERAQVVADLERRVREMNVLIRVAQGSSFTIAFDDILELISAQANQILPARDFRVTLLDKESEILSHVFYLENDERYPEHENRPVPLGRGLEMQVIESQTSLTTEDYEHECRRRGLLPSAEGIYAWVGVPLNAGADTIGVISVASRDPAVLYTEEQRDLLQAIADQASGAIVKARLLDESEQRARQLAKLNEIGVGLTSTLEVRPLLSEILNSAADILNCEAGSLFLVDQETGEIVFEVVIGPVASDLLGKRLPPGTGLVGQAVDTGQAVIANDAKRRKEWFDADEQTGFDTQDLLVVPMRLQDRVIGVIEVINKANGVPFTESDQELLTTFTSQATIAIENARLYTMTDQALAARVEELSVMQRIDRELNASLDIDRAMRITLDWALRQSEADGGLVGTIEDGGLRVMVSQGYSDELTQYRLSEKEDQHYLSVDQLAGLSEAVESGQPQSLLAASYPTGNGFGLLTGAQMQVVVPIRREADVIGVLLLESLKSEATTDDTVSFLTRLSDHAAIAIANARLYEEVIEANLAKSQFVSFVAHELKNPMASIKGYTELVSGGVAGPVNDMQSSFLTTVRSNVDRMNTIVSDLNDLTKIQVGNLRLEYQAMEITESLNEVIRSLQRQIDEKEQKLNLDVPDDLPPVWADPSRLVQILINLVSNATKYTPQGGLISIGAERYAEGDDELAGAEYVHIWVEDSGIGISEEDQAKIFQQYFRTEAAKETATGTGLGLNITQSLVEMQGGRIWFDSVFEEGTTFHFTLPMAEQE